MSNKIERHSGRGRHFDKIMHVLTIACVVGLMAYYVLPMLILREDYIFTIHDGLDGFGGIVQMLHDNHIWIDTFVDLPIMNGVKGLYLLTQYNAYEMLCILFGVLWGHILNRVIGAFLGLFSMKKLLDTVFTETSPLQSDVFWLLSVCYTILPCAPNRTIAFAALPAVVLFYIKLSKRDRFTKFSLLSVLIPFFSLFDAVLMFVIIAWFIAGIADWVRKRRFNVNLAVAFVLICIVTVLVNINLAIIALTVNDTNRMLIFELYNGDLRSLFLQYLDGQYHAPTLHKGLLLNFCVIAFIISLGNYLYNRKRNREYAVKLRKGLLFAIGGVGFWFFTTFLLASREAGWKTGITVIDGFSWGRALALMRFVWIFIFAVLMFSMPKKKFLVLLCYGVMILQAKKIVMVPSEYNDTYQSLRAIYYDYSVFISFRDFFAEDFFTGIKEDMNYNNEGVAAYGFHPSILAFNGFNTIDGYLDVHTMDVQNAFREIIAPALDRMPEYERYYDGWGGRMYLYGELSFEPTVVKPTESYPLYINPEAFKDYGGQYILSRAEISNIDEIGLTFVKDYDSDEGIYHIYLYEVQ